MPGEDAQRVGPLPIAVFFGELALLAVLAAAGALLGGTTAVSVALAIALPLAGAVAWGVWLAPRARGRLPYPARLAAKVATVVIAAVLLAAGGAVGWAVAFLVVVGALFVAGELSER